MTITAAADGSSLGNPGPAGWAWYVDEDTWDAGGWPKGTNNLGELTAILRLANSMDRSHRGKLADCRMAVRDNELIITTGYQGNMALETASFEQKADFFEEIFGVRPVLKQKRRV